MCQNRIKERKLHELRKQPSQISSDYQKDKKRIICVIHVICILNFILTYSHHYLALNLNFLFLPSLFPYTRSD